MRFNSKAYYFLVNELCFPKNPAGYLMDSQPGLSFVCYSTYFRLLNSPIINTAIEMP